MNGPRTRSWWGDEASTGEEELGRWELAADADGAYLASLGTTASRDGMLSALNQAAALLGRGNATLARWEEIRYSDMTLLRAVLIDKRYGPSTANKILAAVRGTLRAAWQLGRMDGETYQQAAAVKAVRGKRLLQGRALEQGEVNALFSDLDGAKAGDARDGALLALLFACGLRRAEAATVTRKNVDLEQGSLRTVAILDALAKAGIAFVALKENIRVEGKRDIQTKVMTTLFAEVERDLVSERTREGLAKARASGRKRSTRSSERMPSGVPSPASPSANPDYS